MKDVVTKFTKKILWLFGIIFIIRCLFSISEIKAGINAYSLYGYIGESVTVTMILAFIYEKYLWRFDKTSLVPVVSGSYKGYLYSDWDKQKRNAKLEIRQTLLSISLVMKTNESRSKSISASIVDVLGEKQIAYCYLNTPKEKVRNRSEIHYGTAMLIPGKDGKIEGLYYTDRKTSGDLYFEKKTTV